jgi:magnesium chelatase family protein
MAIGRTHSVSLLGMQGGIVEIEADLSSNLPSFVIIGLPDTALGEARDRVRAAATNSGCPLPNRKLTVNLSPAALPKHGSGFDLGIALAVLAANGTVRAESIDRVVHLGELGLDGRLRPINGILPAVVAVVAAGFATVMVPRGNEDEAALVPDVRVVGVASLRDAVIWHGGEFDPVEVEPILRVSPTADNEITLDLAEVIGNTDAIDAMVVAASGGDHARGPPSRVASRPRTSRCPRGKLPSFPLGLTGQWRVSDEATPREPSPHRHGGRTDRRRFGSDSAGSGRTSLSWRSVP